MNKKLIFSILMISSSGLFASSTPNFDSLTPPGTPPSNSLNVSLTPRPALEALAANATPKKTPQKSSCHSTPSRASTAENSLGGDIPSVRTVTNYILQIQDRNGMRFLTYSDIEKSLSLGQLLSDNGIDPNNYMALTSKDKIIGWNRLATCITFIKLRRKKRDEFDNFPVERKSLTNSFEFFE